MNDFGSPETEIPIYSIVSIKKVQSNTLTVKDDPLPPAQKQYVVERKYANMNRCLQTFLLLCTVLLFFIIITAAISLGIIFGTPFANVTCTGNASNINGRCQCNYGYNGDGRHFCDECGLSFVNPNVGRIVGGIKALPFSWPSAVLIKFTYKGDIKLPGINGSDGEIVTVKLSSKCGGTLIDRTTVLTAGHCFVDKIRFSYNNEQYTAPIQPTSYFKTVESMYSVYAGLYLESETKATREAASPVQESVASKLVRHEKYNEGTKVNDIALIKLAKPLKLTKEVQVACLPSPVLKEYPPRSQDCWTVGWGKLSDDGIQPDELYNVKLTTYNSTMCKHVAYGVPKNWSAQLCAGEFEGGKDSCQGDSGGSLFVKDEVNNQFKYISVGVVSYGDGCAVYGKPGVYTRISYYLDWINRNL